MKRTLGVTMLAAALAAAPAGAQRPVDAAALETSLQRLNATMSRIADLLERQLESRGAELTLRRIEIASARLRALEERRHGLAREQAAAEEEIVRTRRQLDDVADQIESGEMEATDSDLRRFATEMEFQLERSATRRDELEAERTVLDGEIGRLREELRALQAWVDRELAGL